MALVCDAILGSGTLRLPVVCCWARFCVSAFFGSRLLATLITVSQAFLLWVLIGSFYLAVFYSVGSVGFDLDELTFLFRGLRVRCDYKSFADAGCLSLGVGWCYE